MFYLNQTWLHQSIHQNIFVSIAIVFPLLTVKTAIQGITATNLTDCFPVLIYLAFPLHWILIPASNWKLQQAVATFNQQTEELDCKLKLEVNLIRQTCFNINIIGLGRFLEKYPSFNARLLLIRMSTTLDVIVKWLFTLFKLAKNMQVEQYTGQIMTLFYNMAIWGCCLTPLYTKAFTSVKVNPGTSVNSYISTWTHNYRSNQV